VLRADRPVGLDGQPLSGEGWLTASDHAAIDGFRICGPGRICSAMRLTDTTIALTLAGANEYRL
jgi:hypothetical protein